MKLVLSRLVTIWLSNIMIAFHLRPIWSCQTLFTSFCAQQSDVAVLFNSNLSRRPFLGQVDLDRLLCAGFDSDSIKFWNKLFVIFNSRPMTDQNIERSNGRGFGLQQLLANFIENIISHKKQLLIAAKIYKASKPFWLLNWVSIARVVVCLAQANWVLPAAIAAVLETPCICSPVWPAQAVLESGPKSLTVDFAL